MGWFLSFLFSIVKQCKEHGNCLFFMHSIKTVLKKNNHPTPWIFKFTSITVYNSLRNCSFFLFLVSCLYVVSSDQIFQFTIKLILLVKSVLYWFHFVVIFLILLISTSSLFSSLKKGSYLSILLKNSYRELISLSELSTLARPILHTQTFLKLSSLYVLSPILRIMVLKDTQFMTELE